MTIGLRRRFGVCVFASGSLLAVECGGGISVASAQTIQVNKDNRTVAITTSDQAEAIADVAVVSVGFSTFGVDQDSTYAEGSRISNAIMKALKDAGIKPE